MCGIAGMFGSGDRRVLKSMLHRLTHRGPDGSGMLVEDTWALGAVRLAIVDPMRGHQPKSNSQGTIIVVFNGEIYNHLTLRQKVQHEFVTSCDTEIIIPLYEKYGLRAFSMLEGQFAIALYDHDLKNLFLVRDRFGIKPLHYTRVDDIVYFASEMKALMHLLPKREINLTAVRESGLTGRNSVQDGNPGYHFGNSTFIKGIEQVPVCSILSLQDMRVQDLEPLQHRDRDYSLLLKEAVHERIPDIDFSLSLSGGIDSSTVLCLTDEPSRVQTLTITDDADTEDFAYARTVAEHFGTEHKEIVLDPDILIDSIPTYLYCGESLNVHGAVYLYELARYSKKVLLTGHGGDETLRGYEAHAQPGTYLQELLRNTGHTEQMKALANKGVLSLEEARSFVYAHLLSDPFSNYQLPMVDRMMMAHGVEARVPYLSSNCVHSAKDPRMTKDVLKKIARDCGVPNTVIARDKRGGGTATRHSQQRFKTYSEKIIPRERLVNDLQIRKPYRMVQFDLFKKIFVEEEGSLPKHLHVADLY